MRNEEKNSILIENLLDRRPILIENEEIKNKHFKKQILVTEEQVLLEVK